MKKLIQVLGLVTIISAVGFAPAFANGCNGKGHCYGNGGGGAPAPEIGASALGLLLAGGAAFYVLKRRRV